MFKPRAHFGEPSRTALTSIRPQPKSNSGLRVSVGAQTTHGSSTPKPYRNTKMIPDVIKPDDGGLLDCRENFFFSSPGFFIRFGREIYGSNLNF
jgi:hypothetical protein